MSEIGASKTAMVEVNAVGDTTAGARIKTYAHTQNPNPCSPLAEFDMKSECRW